MNMHFTKQEKLDLLSKYFKQYFTEKLDIDKTELEESVEKDFNLKETLNKTVGPFDGSLNYIADNHKDAFLGKSKGILGAYGTD